MLNDEFQNMKTRRNRKDINDLKIITQNDYQNKVIKLKLA